MNVVFLQGSEVDEVLDLIDLEGVQAGIAHLAQWDFGDETTATAFVSGEVYDQLPAGQSGAHLRRLLEAEQRILNRALFARTTIDIEENVPHDPVQTTARVLARTIIDAPAEVTAETKLPRRQAGKFRFSHLRRT